jgi:hypothetical protein
LGISDRWDLLRQRHRLERWHPFRDRGADVEHRPPLPDYPDVTSNRCRRRAARPNPYIVAGTVGAAIGAVIWVAFGEALGF